MSKRRISAHTGTYLEQVKLAKASLHADSVSTTIARSWSHLSSSTKGELWHEHSPRALHSCALQPFIKPLQHAQLRAWGYQVSCKICTSSMKFSVQWHKIDSKGSFTCNTCLSVCRCFYGSITHCAQTPCLCHREHLCSRRAKGHGIADRWIP